MKNIIIGMSAAAAVLAVAAYLQGGFALLYKGFLIGGQMLWQVGILIILAFAVSGLIQVLVSRDMVSRWMGREAGWKGIFLGAIAGALVPGGPYVFYPLAATFFAAGAEIGTVIAFIIAKNLWTITRLPMEVVLLGPQLTAVRYLITFVFPILLGFAANVLFSNSVEKIREQIRSLQKAGESS